MTIEFSIVVPVFNRPQELDELLASLTQQTRKDFEVIIVEDGSTVRSEIVFAKFSSLLSISYYSKPNSGPGPSRNYGIEKAIGTYVVMFDSDCILPPNYFELVGQSLVVQPLDAWGGPDRGRDQFTVVQRAMAYTMASPFTTGGIRGSSSKNFQPRSFNMGIRREVILKSGGFRFDRFAEDIELSIRLRKEGYRVGLIPDAFVYHKRRTTFREFFRQVSNFGKGRVRVSQVHPEAIKVAHWFPAFFLLGLASIPLLLIAFPIVGRALAAMYTLYVLAIAAGALATTRSVVVSIMSIPSALIQLTGYGFGFLREILKSR